MPNESVPICGCGVALDVGKKSLRNGGKNCGSNSNSIKPRSSAIAKWDMRDRKNQRISEDTVSHQGPAAAYTASSLETGSTSSVQTEQRRMVDKKNSSKQGNGKRLNSSRRTRSAERPETHYTYIDSGSSIVGNGTTIRENVIPEALYASINESPNRNSNPNSISNGQNNHSQTVHAIPSMTSPPPTYDVAMWQSGLPPSYEEYLCHKYAVISRSHTPPPPWSDSTTLVNNGQLVLQSRREILASQPDLRNYLNQLAKAHAHVQAQAKSQSQNNNHTTIYNNTTSTTTATTTATTTTTTGSNRQQQRPPARESSSGNAVQNSNLQISRGDQAVRSQRARTTISRSQSESRARQQRIATMYEDGAFCMETTAIQSAFEHGVAFCSLM